MSPELQVKLQAVGDKYGATTLFVHDSVVYTVAKEKEALLNFEAGQVMEEYLCSNLSCVRDFRGLVSPLGPKTK